MHGRFPNDERGAPNRHRASGFHPSSDAASDVSRVSCPHGQGNRGPQHRGSRGHDLQPPQGLLPGDRPHQARPRPLLPGRRRRRPARGGRPADGAQAVRRRRGRPAVLPEACAGEHARVRPDRHADLPVRPDRRRDRHRRRGRAGLGRQPRLHRPQSAPGPGRGPGPPRRAAGGPRPRAGRAVGPHPARRARDARGARGGRAGRLAQDVRARAGSTSTSGSSRAGRTRRSAGRPSRSPATSSAASPTWRPPSGGRRSATASSSTTTRTPRTGRSPRPIRCDPCPTPASRRR